MGLFEKNVRNTEETTANSVSQILDELRQKYSQYLDEIEKKQTVQVNVEGERFEPKATYELYETEDTYVFIPVLIGKGVTLYDEEIYRKALSLEKIELKKQEYLCWLFEADKCAESVNSYTQKFVVENIKLIFQSEIEQIGVIIKDNQQNFDPIRNLISSLKVKNLKNVVEVPRDSFVVNVHNGMSLLENNKYVTWREDDTLCFVKAQKDIIGKHIITVSRIPLSNILFYKEEGSLRYEQELSGGGGMGINYSKAIIGGLLFGTAGAIIGSRSEQEIKEIKSETKAVDTRVVILKVYDVDKKINGLLFDLDAISAFEWFIPEKEYTHVIEKRRMHYEGIIAE